MEHFSILVQPCKTLLCLIPKKENPTTIAYFCPLGLYTTNYKTLVKILVNKIEPHLGNLISPLQGAYVKGRQVSNPILAQKIMHSMRKSKNKKAGL